MVRTGIKHGDVCMHGCDFMPVYYVCTIPDKTSLNKYLRH